MLLGCFLLSILTPDILRAADAECHYDRNNPSIEHAMSTFMDPALFECAERELRDVLSKTDAGQRAKVAEIHFLLAAALYGRKISADIPDSMIVEHLIKGFLAAPDRTGDWYFSDMPDFVRLVPQARSEAERLLACPYDNERPSLKHAREFMDRYHLYNCAALEISDAMDVLQAAEIIDSIEIAAGYFALSEAYYGMNIIDDAGIADSTIAAALSDGFRHNRSYRGEWRFADRQEFLSLVAQARANADIKEKSRLKPILIIAGIGAAIAGVVAAIVGGGSDDENGSGPDTIPYFPPPPPSR
jgi:hypothetical protein